MVFGTPSRWTFSARGKFFERFDDLAVLGRMSGSRTDVGEADLLQKRAYVSLTIVNAKALLDDTLQIDPPPAHDAILFPIGPRLNDSRKF